MGTEDGKEAKTILLVEDDADLLTFTARTLELEGYSVIQTSGSAEAIEAIQRHHVDLIVLDLMLPDDDEGWIVLEKIMTSPTLSKIPVIIFSAAIDQSNQERAFNMGAAAFLAKPVGVTELTETINNIFR